MATPPEHNALGPDRDAASASPPVILPPQGSGAALWRRLLWPFRFFWHSDKFAFFGSLIVVLFLLTAIFGPFLVKTDPNLQHVSEQLQGPSAGHPLGTDHFGRDVFARTVHGTRLTMAISFSAVGLSTLVGLIIGALAAYYGKWVDQLLMRYIDFQMSIPGLILFVAILAVTGNRVEFLVLALAIGGIPSMARVARGSILSARQEDYVAAARAIGESDLAILFREILPNALSPVLVQLTLYLPSVAFSEAGLSFIGLGPPPPAPSWGRMIADGRDFILLSAWEVVCPGIAITLAVLAFNFLGDGIRDLLDPRYQKVLH